MLRRTLCWLVFLLSLPFSIAEVTTGTPQFGSFGGGPFDTINLANLNVQFKVPIITKAGRGLPFYYILDYESSVWNLVNSGGTNTWTPATNWGWTGQTDTVTGTALVTTQTIPICHQWGTTQFTWK